MDIFLKKSNLEILKNNINFNKFDLIFLAVCVVLYISIGYMSFSLSSKNTSYIRYLERVTYTDIENDISIFSGLSLQILSYVYQSLMWMYITYSYLYNNTKDFKIRFWSIIGVYLMGTLCFPCDGIANSTFIPYITNKYANAFSVTTSLVTFGSIRAPGSKLVYAVPCTVAVLNIMLCNMYVFSEVLALLYTLVVLNVKLPFSTNEHTVEFSEV